MEKHPVRRRNPETTDREQGESRSRISTTIRGVKTYSLVGMISSKEIAEVPDSSAIIPVIGDSILLIGHYRMCVGKYLLEVPGGRMAKGETPEEGARRELLEETGYRAGKMEELIHFYRAPGYSTENVYAFVATNLIQEEGEELSIDLKPTKIEDIVGMIERGEIEDARTIATILSHIISKGRKCQVD